MAANEIRFKELPFRPHRNQVFYIENGYDTDANDFIRNNYHDLKIMFCTIGMDFCYLPYLSRKQNIEAKVRYYAPYLSSEQLVATVQSNAFVSYIPDAETRASLKPSFIFEGTQQGENGDASFLLMTLSEIDFTRPDAIEGLMHMIEQRRKADVRELLNFQICCYESLVENDESNDTAISEATAPSPLAATPADTDGKATKRHARHSTGASPSGMGMPKRLSRYFGLGKEELLEKSEKTFSPEKREEALAEMRSIVETEKVLRELRRTVQKLRLEGVSLMAIHEFIDKQEPLSRMVITPDYRIFLPDYNNMEIVMGALPKAIYFLYLRYPEGIVYKHMQDYYNELLNIYRQLRPNTDEARLNLTITKVVNPLGNSLNENIARIRKAFVEKFDEHLANNYIITGERGAQYAIPLDRELITWEE